MQPIAFQAALRFTLVTVKDSHLYGNVVHVQSYRIIRPLGALLLKIRYDFPIALFGNFLGKPAIILHQMEIELVIALNLKRRSRLVIAKESCQLSAGGIPAKFSGERILVGGRGSCCFSQSQQNQRPNSLLHPPLHSYSVTCRSLRRRGIPSLAGRSRVNGRGRGSFRNWV
ncbi:Hypothetical protein GOX2443 [Gluconobacter oxydans 621H]|uniref:Uncharacterized protein n=1 Tax=Gluconobacter oxydans (strain 621H) TaxID=290633 RepID=Q5FN73_GLUOX|nr:Hypothetical protein GOX2443 [Gluconobacter oxydans 621H]